MADSRLHKSLVHQVLSHARSQCGALSSLPEVVDSRKAGLLPNPFIQGIIMTNKEEALTFVKDNVLSPPADTFISFSDGSHTPEVGAGAAAIEYNPQDPPTSRTIHARVGDADSTPAYQAELTGLELAVAKAHTRAPRTTRFFWFLTDNQTIICDLTDVLRAKPGMTTCLQIRRNLNKILQTHQDLTAAIIWCPSKQDINRVTVADKAEKTACSLPHVVDVTPQPGAVLQRIKRQLQETITATPPKLVLDRLMGFFNPLATYKALSKLKRLDATVVVQIRSGHCPLDAYLHRFKAAETPNCNLCRQRDNICHLLTNCRNFVGLGRNPFKVAKKNKIHTNRTNLLTNSAMFKELGNFVRKSHRFHKARHCRFIKAQPLRPPPPRPPNPPPNT